MEKDKKMEEIKAVYMQCGLLTDAGELKGKIEVPRIPKTNYEDTLLKINTNKSILKKNGNLK